MVLGTCGSRDCGPHSNQEAERLGKGKIYHDLKDVPTEAHALWTRHCLV